MSSGALKNDERCFGLFAMGLHINEKLKNENLEIEDKGSLAMGSSYKC